MTPAAPPVTEAAPPVLLLREARLIGRDEPVDILLENGQISRIGASTTVPRAADGGWPEEVIDLEGRPVIPGLWDEHVHATQVALVSRRIDVSQATSAVETAAIVRDNAVGPDPLLIGFGFRDGLWPDLPTSQLLDDAAPGRAVVLVSGDLHCVWLNRAAADRFDVSVDQSGLLREDAAFAVTRGLADLPEALIDSWVGQSARVAAARGVVGIVDLEMGWNDTNWRRRRSTGFDALRVEYGIYPQHLERAIGEGLSTGLPVDDLLTVGRLKVLIDGSLNTRTAYCDAPYPGTTDAGVLTVPAEQLEALLRTADSAGFEASIHAIGDRAISIALDVAGRVGATGRIEHAQLVADADIPRFSRLGFAASVQPAHLLDDRDVAEHHWAGRTHRAFPLRALLDAGAHVVLGSDAPVSPLDPWVTIAAAVHRTGDEREAWHPEQRITVEEALTASTRAGIAPVESAVADLAVLDADPLLVSARGLREMPVAGTLLGGRFTHRAL